MSKFKTIISIKESRKNDLNKNTPPSFKNTPPLNRIPSGHYQKTPKMIKNKYQIDVDSQLKINQSDSYQELMNLYSSLHVSKKYLNAFNNIIESLPHIFQSSFISHEISKVTKIKYNLLKLQKNISSREKILELLTQYDKYLTYEFENVNIENGIADCKSILSDLRVCSINIVLLIKRIRKEIAYDNFVGKIDLKNEVFNFKNYLQKMKYDVLFLNHSTIGQYLRFGDDFDTFLTCLKREIPYDDNVSRLITKCQYFFIKELIHNQIEENTNKPTISKISIVDEKENKENNSNISNCAKKEIVKSIEEVKPKSNLIEKPITLTIESNISFPYIYEFVSGKISDITNKYYEYYNKIPRNLIVGLNIKDNLNYYLKGVFPQIIQIKQNKSIIGFAIISFIDFDKLIISNIFHINEDKFHELLTDFVNYLSQHFSYKELFIEMYYEYVNGNFILIKPVEEAIKSKAKFRWVNMENDGTERKIKYKIINKNYKNEENANLIKLKTLEILSLKCIEQKNEEQNNNNDNQNDSLDINNNESALVIPQRAIDKKEEIINKFPLFSLFCEMMYNNEYNVESESLRHMNMEEMKSISENMINNYIQIDQKKLEEEIKEKIKIDTKLLKEEVLKEESKFNYGSFMKLDVFFENVITTKIGEVLYNKISYDKISLLSLPSGEIFYLLKTKNEKISIILYENSNEKSKLNNYFSKNIINTCTLNDYMNQIYPEMSSINDDENAKQNIYIPIFTVNTNNTFIEPKDLDEFTVDTEDQNSYNIEKYYQNDQIIFNHDNKVNDHFISFDINESTDVVIKNEFLISIINYDTLTQFEIPSISSFIISQKMDNN